LRLRTIGLISTLVLGLLVAALSAEAQQAGKIPRIGFLGNSSPSSDAIRIEAFRQGLRELGYVEGKNIVIEYRYAEGKLDRLPNLAAELVHLKVDVIVGRGTRAVRAAQSATSTIPIVMASVADAVRSGLVASLARPGGNITGLTSIMPELAGKRLELLKEIVPKVSRVAFLTLAGRGAGRLMVKEAQDAGQSIGVQIQPLVVKGPEEFESAFSAMVRERVEALVIQPFFVGGLGHGRRIADLAIKNRLLTISDQSQFANEGGLISYGPDVVNLTRRAASYVDKILKGANPARLPVEQPKRFKMVINLKTAKKLVLEIPPSILYRADKVIR